MVFIVILVVSVFYYMKSKGKGVTDLSCVGTGGKFRKLMSSDVESSRPGLLGGWGSREGGLSIPSTNLSNPSS